MLYEDRAKILELVDYQKARNHPVLRTGPNLPCKLLYGHNEGLGGPWRREQ